jgi:Transglycosylase SLT domain
MVGVGHKGLRAGFLLAILMATRIDGAFNPEEIDGTPDAAASTNLNVFVVADDLTIAMSPSDPGAEADRPVLLERTKMEDLPAGALEYVARLKPIFAAEGVPSELVWLAEVESGFDTVARSPIGAAGLFQLMPDTAEWLGLTLTPTDQRLQPEKNARAAARYLKYLHGTFHDWRLAIAAYNGGEGLVGRLIEKRRTRHYDEIAPGLPTETQLYVPKVDATVLRREGVTLEELRTR